MCREGAWDELAVEVTSGVGIQRRMLGKRKYYKVCYNKSVKPCGFFPHGFCSVWKYRTDYLKMIVFSSGLIKQVIMIARMEKKKNTQ